MAESTTPPGSSLAPNQQGRRGRPPIPTPNVPPPKYHASIRYATSQVPEPSTRIQQPGTDSRGAFPNADENSATSARPRPPLSPSLGRQWSADEDFIDNFDAAPRYSLSTATTSQRRRTRHMITPQAQAPYSDLLDSTQSQQPHSLPPFPEDQGLTSAQRAPLLDDPSAQMQQSGRHRNADYMVRPPAATRNVVAEFMRRQPTTAIEQLDQDPRRVRTRNLPQFQDFQDPEERLEGRRGFHRPLEDTAFGPITIDLEAARAVRAIQNGHRQTRVMANTVGERDLRQNQLEHATTTVYVRRRVVNMPDISSQYESGFGLAADGLTASVCPACTDDVDVGTDVVLRECGHKWHIECLNKCFEVALSNKQHFPPRCCRNVLHRNRGCIDYEPIKTQLDNDVVALWDERAEEWLSKDPTYCQTKGCTGGFISQAQIKSRSAHCLVCERDTCVECKAPASAHINGSHPNMLSKEDEALMEEKNWKQCPNLRCRKVLERTDGCDHMTCSECGEQFCYRCGKKQSQTSVGCPCITTLPQATRRNGMMRHTGMMIDADEDRQALDQERYVTRAFQVGTGRVRDLFPNEAGHTIGADGARRAVDDLGPMGRPLGENREQPFQNHVAAPRAPRTPFPSRAPSPTRYRDAIHRERLSRALHVVLDDDHFSQEHFDEYTRRLNERFATLRQVEHEEQELIQAVRRRIERARGGYHG